MLQRASRLEKPVQEQLLAFFAKDLTATAAASLIGVNRNTANLWYRHFRQLIAEQIWAEGTPRFKGAVEIDQASFGHKGKKKRVARRGRFVWQERKRKSPKEKAKEVQVFGILERNGRVYAHVIPNNTRETLIPIIHLVVEDKATIYSDEWRAFSILKKDGYRHVRVNHTEAFSRKRGRHINGIEAFWSFSKRRLNKFNGLPKNTLPLHVKECEFRYNHRKDLLPVLEGLIEARRTR